MFFEQLQWHYYRSFEDPRSAAKLQQILHDYDPNHLLSEYKTYNTQALTAKSRETYLQYFHFAAERVPAYKDFLKKNSIDHTKVKSYEDFQNVPWINKKNYLSNYSLRDLCVDGKLTQNTYMSVSSGSSGVPMLWPRGNYQQIETYITHELFLKDFFNIDNSKTLFINSYSMGMYVAGVFTTKALSHIAGKGYDMLLLTPGLNKYDALKSVRELEGYFDQYIFAGYPPFVKDVIDLMIREGMSFSGKKVRFLFGAETFSERWRSLLLEKVAEQDTANTTMNTYGSADAAILGHETPLSITAKGLLENKPDAANAMMGSTRLFSLMQYNPMLRFFEVQDNELLFSAFTGIPLLRYNIHDAGGVLGYYELFDKLKQNGIDLEQVTGSASGAEHWKLPFVYLFGKSDHTVTFYGLNVYPENIRAALEQDELKNLASGRFTLKRVENRGDQRLNIQLELSHGTEPSEGIQSVFEKIIVSTLRQTNLEYNELLSKVGKLAIPEIAVHPKDSGPFQKDEIKQRWVQNEPQELV